MRAALEAENVAVLYGYISADSVGVMMPLATRIGAWFWRLSPDQSNYRNCCATMNLT